MKQNNNHTYFKLYSNCIPVEGASRSAIYDLQKGKIRFIPKLLFEILKENKGKSLKELKEYYNNKYDRGIDLYLNQLVDENIGFFTDDLDSFPDLDLKFHFPGVISNAIIEINTVKELSYSDLFTQLELLGCVSVEFRFSDNSTLNDIKEILRLASNRSLIHLHIVLKYKENISINLVKDLVSINLRLLNITIHSSPSNKSLIYDNCSIKYKKNIINNSSCGVINEKSFSVSIQAFTEAQNFNSCLNKKVSISSSGDIKNCPALKTVFGNIKNDFIKDVVSTKSFQKMWLLKKDDIDGCKMCEFRYACFDCRAFLEDDNVLAKPKKCSYEINKMIWES